MENLIEIVHNDQEFSFRLKETIKDASLIEREASKLAGGALDLAELTTACDEAMERVVNYNSERYGKDESKAKYKKYHDLIREGKTDTKEYTELAKELHSNKHFLTWIELSSQRSKIYSYARLIVMCEKKPEGYDWYEKEPEELDQIVKKLSDEQVFFRRYDR